MTSIQILFLGFCVLGLFGSLSLVTPHVLWNDLTYFFRKDRKEYLTFSNRYHGKMYLVIGLISFVLFLVSWFVRIVVSLYAVFFVYIAFWMLAEVLIQIHWLRKSKKDQKKSSPFIIRNYACNISTIFSLKSGRSSGVRLVTSLLSTTTGSSLTIAPAQPTSGRTVSQAVIVRPFVSPVWINN